MTRFLSPGIAAGSKDISLDNGKDIAFTAAIVVRATKGPVLEPVLITSHDQLHEIFGTMQYLGPISASTIHSYLDKGGRIIVIRIPRTGQRRASHYVTAPIQTAEPTPVALTLVGPNYIRETQSAQYQAIVTYDDSNQIDVSADSDVCWMTEDPTRLSVSATGFVDALNGTTPATPVDLGVSWKGLFATLSVDVDKPFRPITLLSAGNDQNIVCAGTVFLRALVTPDDPFYTDTHTYEWVQLTGAPITFDSNGGLSTSFVANGSSVTIRLYVDRGTEFEQYADVFIDATPTSRTASTAGGLQVLDAFPAFKVSANMIANWQVTFVEDTKGGVSSDAQNAYLTWEAVENAQNYRVMRYVSGTGWTLVTTTIATYYGPITDDSAYRVDAVVQLPNTSTVSAVEGDQAASFKYDDSVGALSATAHSQHGFGAASSVRVRVPAYVILSNSQAPIPSETSVSTTSEQQLTNYLARNIRINTIPYNQPGSGSDVGSMTGQALTQIANVTFSSIGGIIIGG